MYVTTKDGMNVVNYGGSRIEKDRNTGMYLLKVKEYTNAREVVYDSYETISGAKAVQTEMLNSYTYGRRVYG